MLLVIGESGPRFEETSRRSRSCIRSLSHPISACRNLFGSSDPAETKADLRRLSERLTVDASERWNFDFPAGRPIAGGRYGWELCSDGKDARRSSGNEAAVFQSPNSSRDDSDDRISPNSSSADDGRFFSFAPVTSSRVSASRDDWSDTESALSPTIAKDDRRSFSRIGDDDAVARNCVSENPKRFQNSKQSYQPRMSRYRGFGQIRRRRLLSRQSRSVEKTLSSFITDYFPKKKRSGGSGDRDPK